MEMDIETLIIEVLHKVKLNNSLHNEKKTWEIIDQMLEELAIDKDKKIY